MLSVVTNCCDKIVKPSAAVVVPINELGPTFGEANSLLVCNKLPLNANPLSKNSVGWL